MANPIPYLSRRSPSIQHSTKYPLLLNSYALIVFNLAVYAAFCIHRAFANVIDLFSISIAPKLYRCHIVSMDIVTALPLLRLTLLRSSLLHPSLLHFSCYTLLCYTLPKQHSWMLRLFCYTLPCYTLPTQHPWVLSPLLVYYTSLTQHPGMLSPCRPLGTVQDRVTN